MEIQGSWRKDPDGLMEFETSQLQRYYEAVTDQYYKVYNQFLDELDDEELASDKAREEGYKMVTDYKTINGKQEFATTYVTPSYLLDLWFEFDPVTNKRVYEKGYLKISKR